MINWAHPWYMRDKASWNYMEGKMIEFQLKVWFSINNLNVKESLTRGLVKEVEISVMMDYNEISWEVCCVYLPTSIHLRDYPSSSLIVTSIILILKDNINYHSLEITYWCSLLIFCVTNPSPMTPLTCQENQHECSRGSTHKGILIGSIQEGVLKGNGEYQSEWGLK